MLFRYSLVIFFILSDSDKEKFVRYTNVDGVRTYMYLDTNQKKFRSGCLQPSINFSRWWWWSLYHSWTLAVEVLQATPVCSLFVLSYSLRCRSFSLAHLDQRDLDVMISSKWYRMTSRYRHLSLLPLLSLSSLTIYTFVIPVQDDLVQADTVHYALAIFFLVSNKRLYGLAFYKMGLDFILERWTGSELRGVVCVASYLFYDHIHWARWCDHRHSNSLDLGICGCVGYAVRRYVLLLHVIRVERRVSWELLSELPCSHRQQWGYFIYDLSLS